MIIPGSPVQNLSTSDVAFHNFTMDTPETNIDRLLKARAEIDEQLRQHKTNTAVLFTDVVASTKYFDRYGDTAGFAMVERHAQLGAGTVREFDGRVVKTIGDSIMAEFSDPVACVHAAIELQRKLYRMNEKLPERDRLQLRIGINYGACFLQEGDLFGDAVNLAARITKHTGPSQILISSSVHRAMQKDPSLICSSLGEINFKGKAEKEEIFEVVWTDPVTYANLRKSSTVALVRGELLSPGLKVEDLTQKPEDVGRDKLDHVGVTPAPSNREGPSARFVAGMVIAGRYRIIAFIGKGGMGEVYRAEDLKIEQEVALKFLGKEIRDDGASLARLHREVRVARQVSHRNVCRVFDIEDADGMPFLIMEYVDGEDLQSLLHRIGHFPRDRGIDLARQICGGLSAAHEFDILHRDLKPANIMVDAKGHARIMDFGLATLGQPDAKDMRAGTPAYMAPEQLDGGKLTVKSDIYSLGLVLYEIFTGERVFDAVTLPELLRQRDQPLSKSPSTVVKDLDPLVNNVILQCLQKDPAKRPASAFEVVVGLPGGDPVRAALAAGETPSPEMIAASGPSGGLRPVVAWALLATAWILMVGNVFLYAPTRFYNHMKLTQSPEELKERASEFVEKIGYVVPPVDNAYSFDRFSKYLNYIGYERAYREKNLSPLSLTFWYRQSPQFLVSASFFQDISADDPPLSDPGMIGLGMDASGRVIKYVDVPPLKDDNVPPAPAPDWNRILSDAGYGTTGWTAVAPQRIPATYADARAAYQGTLPDIPDVSIRVEMATFRGKLVSLETVFPWSQKEEEFPPAVKLVLALILTLAGITLIPAIWLCRRNVLKGRGDRRGAFRLAFLVFIVNLLHWIFSGHHVPGIEESITIIRQISIALLLSVLVWVLYIALEPLARRHWPLTLVSWNRVLAAKLRDPLVGKDILIGCVAGSLCQTLGILQCRIPVSLGGRQFLSSLPPMFVDVQHAIASALDRVNLSLVIGIAFFFVIAFLRASLRRNWLAYGIFVLFASLDAGGPGIVGFGLGLLASVLLLVVLIRFGLVAVVVSFYVLLCRDVAITFDTSLWFFGFGLLGSLIPAVLAVYGFYFSLAGRPMFGAMTLDE